MHFEISHRDGRVLRVRLLSDTLGSTKQLSAPMGERLETFRDSMVQEVDGYIRQHWKKDQGFGEGVARVKIDFRLVPDIPARARNYYVEYNSLFVERIVVTACAEAFYDCPEIGD